MVQQEIEKFTVSQFKGIVGTIEITPSGPGLIIIAGPNGSGKSSVVDGILQLVSPVGVKGIPKPVNDGAGSAYVEMTTNGFRARRTYKEDGPGELDVWPVGMNSKITSPASFITAATGGQIFDTAQFVGMHEKDQRAELLRRVALPFNLDELESARDKAFKSRTDVSREVKRLTIERSALAVPPAGTPTEEVSQAALMAEFRDASEHNAQLTRFADIAAELSRSVEAIDREIAQLEQRLAAAKTEHAAVVERAEEASVAAHASEIIDIEGIRSRLEAVEQTNILVRSGQRAARMDADLAAERAKESSLTAEIKAIDAQKADGLAAAEFPVPGLSVDDNGITHNGIPFKQINDAMKIIVAFDLATVGKPELRLVFIKNGDMLDPVSLAGIEKIAVARGYYVVIERDRPDAGDVSFIVRVHDGALVES